MTLEHLLRESQKKGLRPEMEVFLSFLLQVDRSALLARSDEEVPVHLLAPLQTGWVQLMDGCPVAYLTHQKEFYGLPFYVDERVLVPRDATEAMVEFAIHEATEGATVLEIGTGSGAVAVSLSHVRPDLTVFASDISADALAVANKNCIQHNAHITFFESDLLEKVPVFKAQLLLANLPYIGEQTHHFIAENVEKYEPSVALFGGDNGLRLYERLFSQLVERPTFDAMMGEIGFTQAEELKALAHRFFPQAELEIRPDAEGFDRNFILRF